MDYNAKDIKKIRAFIANRIYICGLKKNICQNLAILIKTESLPL